MCVFLKSITWLQTKLFYWQPICNTSLHSCNKTVIFFLSCCNLSSIQTTLPGRKYLVSLFLAKWKKCAPGKDLWASFRYANCIALELWIYFLQKSVSSCNPHFIKISNSWKKILAVYFFQEERLGFVLIFFQFFAFHETLKMS